MFCPAFTVGQALEVVPAAEAPPLQWPPDALDSCVLHAPPPASAGPATRSAIARNGAALLRMRFMMVSFGRDGLCPISLHRPFWVSSQFDVPDGVDVPAGVDAPAPERSRIVL